MTAEAFQVEATLQARYPLPDWVVDSKFKYELTLMIADTIANEITHDADCKGATAQQDFAEHVTRAVRDTLKPLLIGLTDDVGHPGDVLVSYISQLALTRPGEAPDIDHYRELLRSYVWFLARRTQRFDFRTPA